MTKEYKAEDLVERLRYRFAGDAYVVLEQVADCTGAAWQQWIDAVVIGLWPSKGLMRSAFEIKVDRSDYLREIENPNKNAWVRECFHEFWYVAPKGVIKTIDELPEGCGWMQPHGKTLKTVKAAARKDNPTLDDALLASLARSLQADKKAFVRNAKASVLENSSEHQEALICLNAVKKFLVERGDHYYSQDKESEILKKLMKATSDKKIKDERGQVLSLLNRFQNRIFELFQVFTILAYISILERNEAGEFIVKSWGGVDEEMIETIRRKRPRNKYDRKNRDEKLLLYDFLADCAAAVMAELPEKPKKLTKKAKVKRRSALFRLVEGNDG